MRKCPFCENADAEIVGKLCECINCGATAPVELWDCRPTEDDLRASIEDLKDIILDLETRMSDDKTIMQRNTSFSSLDDLIGDYVDRGVEIEDLRETVDTMSGQIEELAGALEAYER